MASAEWWLRTVIAVCSVTHISGLWFMSRRTPRVPCFPGVGCFPVTYPFNNSASFEPMAPENIHLSFVLLRQNGLTRNFTLNNLQERLNGVYQPQEKTVVLFHGYHESINIPWMVSLVPELLRKEPMNLICVDWARAARNFWYYQSMANARMVGALTALALQNLVGLGANLHNFHLIGFSLGAHVAGHVGQRLPGIGRITGLDPAGPMYDGSHPSARLDPGDALFVDVLHTDIASVGLGARQPMGHVDFYVNGGSNQPGCSATVMASISSISRGLLNRRVPQLFICNHLRAAALFQSSIMNSCSFPMYLCEDQRHLRPSDCQVCGDQEIPCPTFGYNMDSSVPLGSEVRQIYRLNTTAIYPFCQTHHINSL